MGRKGNAALKASDERLTGVMERLKAGSPLLEESKGLGFTHNGQLRAALRELIGTEQYAALMEDNAARSPAKRGRPKRKKRCSPVQAAASPEGSEQA